MENKKIKKELVLSGLDCASCSAKIEKEVNDLDGVNASMNFVTKTLTIESNNDEMDNNINKAKKIILDHEPHVKIIDKKIIKKSYLISDLDCANCASKIEMQVGKLGGITLSNLDFVTKKLTINVIESIDSNELLNEITNVVKSIESEADVEELTTAKVKNEEEEEGYLFDIIKICVSLLLVLVAFIFDFGNTIEFIMLLVSYLIVGSEVLISSVKNIIKGKVFDENFLMSIATIGAFAIGEYFEAVAVMLFYQIGELFQKIAVNRSRKSITKLMNIRPDYANIKVNDDIKKVSPEEVSVGDIIVVKPGEKIPLDGVIINGNSYLDVSALTGESMLKFVDVSSEVLSGSINTKGLLEIRVTKVYSESTIAKILDLVEHASSKKSNSENFITKFARYYTPTVVISALLIAVIPSLLGGNFNEWLYKALIFLVISCPCALVISVPLSFFGGIGGASKLGILVKGGNYLEALTEVGAVVFDKTGTLTKGKFEVVEVVPVSELSKDELIKVAAYAEAYSTHPIAMSILRAYNQDIDKSLISDYQEVAGLGLSINYNGKNVKVGNSKLINKLDINKGNDETIVYVTIDDVYQGYIKIADEVKDDAKKAISMLKDVGVNKTIMLTGDVSNVANKVANELGIDEVYAELLPQNKVEKVEEIALNSKSGKVIFVGDGINDAPVLARADIGIAMGGLGSDAAIEAADIVIMNDEPSKIATAIKVANKTKKIVIQNIVFALAVKLLFLILGVVGFTTMWEAVFADVGVSLIAIINATRVMNTKKL
jgi:Cd2+/Zn2+-exporting ATPase